MASKSWERRSQQCLLNKTREEKKEKEEKKEEKEKLVAKRRTLTDLVRGRAIVLEARGPEVTLAHHRCF